MQKCCRNKGIREFFATYKVNYIKQQTKSLKSRKLNNLLKIILINPVKCSYMAL